MADENRHRPLTWDDIASPNWYSDGPGPVWISGYLIMMADQRQISPEPIVIDFEFAKAIAFYGQIPYVRLIEFEPESTETPQFRTKAEEVTSKEGAHLILVLPFDDSDPSHSEGYIKVKIQELIGILTAVFGPNLAYHRLFDNVVRPKESQRTAFGKFFRAPSTMPSPDLSPDKVQIVEVAVQNLSKLPESEANRVRLSLRWYYESQYAVGVDIFLKLWFALEALGMATKDNIEPIIRSLSKAYNLEYQDAKNKFSIGRLFGFRSRIVHQGAIYPIHAHLSDYVAALYQDVLYEKLGLPHQGFAAKIQEDLQFNLKELMG